MSTPWGRYTIQIHLPSRYTNLRYIYPSLGIPTPQVYLSPDTYPPQHTYPPPELAWHHRYLLPKNDLVQEISTPHGIWLGTRDTYPPWKGPGIRDTYTPKGTWYQRYLQIDRCLWKHYLPEITGISVSCWADEFSLNDYLLQQSVNNVPHHTVLMTLIMSTIIRLHNEDKGKINERTL